MALGARWVEGVIDLIILAHVKVGRPLRMPHNFNTQITPTLNFSECEPALPRPLTYVVSFFPRIFFDPQIAINLSAPQTSPPTSSHKELRNMWMISNFQVTPPFPSNCHRILHASFHAMLHFTFRKSQNEAKAKSDEKVRCVYLFGKREIILRCIYFYISIARFILRSFFLSLT